MRKTKIENFKFLRKCFQSGMIELDNDDSNLFEKGATK